MSVSGNVERLRSQIQEPIFKRMLIASVVLHLAVLFSFTLRTYVFTNEAIDVESAIQVDIVDLPDKFQKLPPLAEEKKTEPNPLPMDKPKLEKKIEASKKVDLKAKKKSKDDALEKIKAMQALEKIKDEVTQNEQKENFKKLKGNIRSSGMALRGIVTTQVAGYTQLIKRHANDNWSLPKWLQDLDLKARAQVYIDEGGNVVKRMIVQSSGNETFDDIVLATIDKASPFPSPPQHFVDLVKVKGIQLGFPE